MLRKTKMAFEELKNIISERINTLGGIISLLNTVEI